MKKIAVIVAAGQGTRMGKELPKQFLLLHGKPLLYYTLKTFLDAYKDLQVVLVLPVDYIELGKEILDAYFSSKPVKIVSGGTTRFMSVKNGLSIIEEEAIIFVHDGVRCLVSNELIHRCYETALSEGSAIPVISVEESLRKITEDGNEIIDRNTIKIVQTPQTFHSKILLPAYRIDDKEHFTDEASVVEAFGLKLTLIEGEKQNIKITRPVDLQFAELLVNN
ncbi:MAG: 2-C-methyl-D-erythritol 4-phosphate cytidylyltransferase [Chitinophagaceae bacterium]|nr:2-C-methyl-D-erythritol 4-phosphate cytidylyltransferase [Chitinophagaceae bacterium]